MLVQRVPNPFLQTFSTQPLSFICILAVAFRFRWAGLYDLQVSPL